MDETAFQQIRDHEPTPQKVMVSCAHHQGGRQSISIDVVKIYYNDQDHFCKDCPQNVICAPKI